MGYYLLWAIACLLLVWLIIQWKKDAKEVRRQERISQLYFECMMAVERNRQNIQNELDNSQRKSHVDQINRSITDRLKRDQEYWSRYY